jgi:hypothetical protein
LRYAYGRGFDLKIAYANSKEGNGVTLLTIGLGYFQAKLPPVWIPQLFSNLVIIHLLAYDDGTDRVFRNVGI